MANANQPVIQINEGKVGIGTTTPTKNLEIEGQSSQILLKSTVADQNASIQFNAKVGTTQALRWEAGTNISSPLDFEIFDRIASVSRFLIEGVTGNVGIGTTSPTSNLHIETTNSSAYLQLRRNFTGSKGRLFLGSESVANIIASQGDAATDAKPLAFQIAETEKMRIDDTGNVGIKTTNPLFALDITEATAETNTLKDVLRLSHITSGTAASGLGAGILFSAERALNGFNLSRGAIYGVSGTNTNDDGVLAFHTRTNTAGDSATTGMNEKMRINSIGNVGIGTSTPLTGGADAKWLTINGKEGSTYSGGISYTINSVSKAFSYFQSDYLIQQSMSGYGQKFMVNGGSTAMTILQGGNVGIGTSTPQAPLNIHSISGVASGQYNSPSALMLSSGNGTANVGGTILFGADLDSASAASNTQASIYSSNSNSNAAGSYGNLNFATKDTLAATVLTPRMTIEHTGNVGIGTTSPDAKLDIESSASTMLRVSATSDVLGEVGGIEFSQAGTRNASIRVNRTVADGRKMDMRFYIGSNSEAMRIIEDGTIKVGADADSYLNIIPSDGTSTPLLQFLKSDAGNQYALQFIQGSIERGSIKYSGTGTIFNTSSDYRLKEDLKDFNGLEMVSNISVYDYKWKSEDSRSYGVMAHELESVLPDAVSGEKDAENMQGVDYSKIVPVLIKAIQELKAEIDILKTK